MLRRIQQLVCHPVRLLLLGLMLSSTLHAHEGVEAVDSDRIYSYLAKGQLALARESASTRIDRENPGLIDADVLGALGLAELGTGQTDQGVSDLLHAISLGSGPADHRFRWHLALLDLWSLQSPVDARFDEVRKGADRLAASDTLRVLKLRLTLIKRALRVSPDSARSDLEKLLHDMASLPQGTDRARLYLVVAEAARQGQRGGMGATSPWLAIRFNALNQAVADGKDEPEMQSMAELELVRLYREEHREDDAINIAKTAMTRSGEQLTPSIAWQLEAERGRSELKMGHIAQALQAFASAFDAAESIRTDLPKLDEKGRSWFSQTLFPLYLERISLLVEQSAVNRSKVSRHALLKESILTLEAINRASLEEFLGHTCGVPDQKLRLTDLLDNGEAHTAFLYPFLAGDRGYVILASSGEMEVFPLGSMNARTLQQKLGGFAKVLANQDSDPLPLAKEIYGFLFAPLETTLKKGEVKRIVVVPDSLFRKIPLAALHDGKSYLVTRYAFTTLTGLSLFNPKEDIEGDERIFVAGLSDPGPVVEELPDQVNREVMNTARARGINRGAASPPSPGRPVSREVVKEALRLPGVEKEVEVLRPMAGSVLTNKTFTLDQLYRTFEEQQFSALHIASHGVIGRSAQQSFILTYDHLLKFGDLEKLLQSGRQSGHLKLLTLSACHSAEGDEQAPLGLSGLALKANVPRALGSLWPVDDQATVHLMQNFYQGFLREDRSASVALSESQQKLLDQPEFRHPFYWAPFILVGRWW